VIEPVSGGIFSTKFGGVGMCSKIGSDRTVAPPPWDLGQVSTARGGMTGDRREVQDLMPP
jgi:hypothetical protein